MIEIEILPGEFMLIDEDSEEYAILFHKTKEDEEYIHFLKSLDKQEE